MPRKSNESSWFGSVGQKWEGSARRKADHSANGTQRSSGSSTSASPLSGLLDWAVGSGEGETIESSNSSELGYSWNSTSSTSFTTAASSPSKYESIASSSPSTTSSYPSFWFPGVADEDGSAVTSRGYLPQDPPFSSSSSTSSNASSPLFLFLDFGGASSGSSASAAASVSPVAYAGAPSHASAAGPAAQSAPSVGAPPHSPSSHSPGANGSASGVAASSVASSPAAGILLMLPSPWNETAAENATLPAWDSEEGRNLWALLLVLFPLFTLFGNVLVILSVHRERALQTVTNYFIVSLALADLLVAVLVMPFAVYVLVNGEWGLPTFVCDFYIAMDVTCSTSSIFNLVAISIDRYIAVTQPIKYAKHKSQRRVWLTIALVWVISAAIGSPIVLGLNNTSDRQPNLCVFYNSDFIIYSSLSSFYIPCIIMVFLYYNIFKALRSRARRAKAARRPNTSSSAMKPGAVIENLAQTRRLAETALGGAGGPLPLSLPLPLTGGGSGGGSGPGSLAQSSAFDDDKPTNTGSGSQEEEEDEEEDEEEEEEEEERDGGLEHSIPFDEDDDDCDGCHVIPNDKSTEFILATVTAERRRRRQRQQQSLAAAGVVAAGAAVGTNGKRLSSPSASPTAPPIVSATAAAPVVACGIVVATTGVGGDDGVAVGGNHDSGYAASNAVEEEASPVPAAIATPKRGEGSEAGGRVGELERSGGGGRRHKKKRTLLSLQRDSDEQMDKSKARKNGAAMMEGKAAASRDMEGSKGAKKGVLKSAVIPSQSMGAAAAAASAAGVGLSAAVASKKERKSGSRFTIYKVHKASRKKREKSSAKKERKATKTLAIVLGVFLFCWVPFFTCNIMDAICTKLVAKCQPGVTAFILTTWLGYMNSFVNPVIYTIFNPEFRKAFKKLMSVGT